jgi:hypothetical protein
MAATPLHGRTPAYHFSSWLAPARQEYELGETLLRWVINMSSIRSAMLNNRFYIPYAHLEFREAVEYALAGDGARWRLAFTQQPALHRVEDCGWRL